MRVGLSAVEVVAAAGFVVVVVGGGGVVVMVVVVVVVMVPEREERKNCKSVIANPSNQIHTLPQKQYKPKYIYS